MNPILGSIIVSVAGGVASAVVSKVFLRRFSMEDILIAVVDAAAEALKDVIRG